MSLRPLRNVSREEYGCYPEYADLNNALSEFLEVEEDCVIPTNGSDEAIKTIFDTYVEKGDEVILLSPSYSMYELYAQVAGAKIVWISYRLNDFYFPIEEILNAIRPNTRLIALANPNNPTGTLIRREDLLRIVEANPKWRSSLMKLMVLYAKANKYRLGNHVFRMSLSHKHSQKRMAWPA